MTSLVAIVAGAAHSLAARSDETVWAWGSNTNGRLGDETTQRLSPVPVTSAASVTCVAAGTYQSLALKSDGSVLVGGSGYGQVGDGTLTDRPTPVRVSGLALVRDLAAGRLHSLARLADGTLRMWGGNGTTLPGVRMEVFVANDRVVTVLIEQHRLWGSRPATAIYYLVKVDALAAPDRFESRNFERLVCPTSAS
ncbi:MAG: hypothetical protein U0Q12_24950 [Vicinamibacterales bacterium]